MGFKLVPTFESRVVRVAHGVDHGLMYHFFRRSRLCGDVALRRRGALVHDLG
jgi:hypothetical protein